MADKVPSIGRIVHFINGDLHLPAIITDPAFDASDGAPTEQALTVFPTGKRPFFAVAHEDSSDTPKPATWHWPEYVPDT